MSETYFPVVLTGDAIKQLLSLIHCEEHGRLIVGMPVDMGAVYRVGTTMVVDKTAVKKFSEFTPELKTFFDALLTDKRKFSEFSAIDTHEYQERRALRTRVLDCAQGGDFVLARKTYEDYCADWWPLTDYQQALRNEALARQFITLLKDGPLYAIDRFFIEYLYGQLSDHELATLKLPLLRLHLA